MVDQHEAGDLAAVTILVAVDVHVAPLVSHFALVADVPLRALGCVDHVHVVGVLAHQRRVRRAAQRVLFAHLA